MTVERSRIEFSRLSSPIDPQDRGGRRILILTPFPPRLDGAHGGARTTARLITSLAVNNRIALAYLRAADEASIDESLSSRVELIVEGRRGGTMRSSIRPLSRAGSTLRGFLGGLPLWVAGRRNAKFAGRVHNVIAEWRPSVVQAEFSAMGQYLPRSDEYDGVSVVTFHEPGIVGATERIADGSLTKPFWIVESRRWRAFESALLRRVDAAVAFTARDAGVLRELERAADVEIIPLGVELATEPFDDKPDATKRLLFVGNFVHPPNIDAAELLAHVIHPALRVRFPSLELWIVGPGAPRRLTGQAGVKVTGEVPDVAPYLRLATIVVVPLRKGGGMRVKVLEAMAAGKAIVATPLAVEGIDVASGREVVVASEPEEFIAAITELLSDADRRRHLGVAARTLIEADHSPRAAAAAYESLYTRLEKRRTSAGDAPAQPAPLHGQN